MSGKQDLSLFTVAAPSQALSRVGLQWLAENLSGKQDLSLFTVLALSQALSRVGLQ